MALPFSGTPLSCPTGLREDEIKLHKLKIREDALFLVCSKFNPATTESGDLFWVPWSVVHSIAADSDRPIFLGLAPDGSPRFAIEIGDSLEEWNNFIPNGFQNIRSIAAQLADNRTAIVAQAHSILKWI
ncbi:MAG: NUDIX-like domain-containing protein, partial [Arenicellales bacterium]